MRDREVWFCIPSARPAPEANEALRRWRDQGYKIALQCDTLEQAKGKICDALRVTPYEGYPKAVNALTRYVMASGKCDWVVTGGDDTYPDPSLTARQIGDQCEAHFLSLALSPTRLEWCEKIWGAPGGDIIRRMETFGIMQPTGDRFAGGEIDRICGSPWMGREFCERIYGGNGPLWEEFRHMHVDEHLQAVAKKLGILWQRPDITHFHNHFTRNKDVADYSQIRPRFLDEPNSAPHWARSSAIFSRLKAGGFAEANNLKPLD